MTRSIRAGKHNHRRVTAPPLALVELSSAAWGFIGVVVGAALSIVKDFVVEGRRAKREREAESRREKDEVQIACRLVAEELDTITLDARTLSELQRTPVSPVADDPEFLPTREWHEHKQVLARVLDDAAIWSSLAAIYHDAASLRARATSEGPNSPLPKDYLPRLDDLADTANYLSGVLLEAAVADEKSTQAAVSG